MIDLFAPPTEAELKYRERDRIKNCDHEWGIVMDTSDWRITQTVIACMYCKKILNSSRRVYNGFVCGSLRPGIAEEKKQ